MLSGRSRCATPARQARRSRDARKRDLHGQPAPSDARADMNLRIEMRGNARDDRQAEPAAVAARGRGRAAKEAVGETQRPRRDAGAVVGDVSET
ncbi:conserved hypothetical protein, partial [Ricinus communis]